jgi:hypothetical protein
VSLDSYIFDQDFARKALVAMIILHEYTLCIVDHAGFRRFVSALNPKFKLVHMNTIRYNHPPFSFMYCCVLVLQGTLVDSFHVSDCVLVFV